MQDAAKIQNQVLGQIFSISSDNQRLTYLQQNRWQLDVFLSLVAQYLPDAPKAVQTAFDLVLRRKALGAEAAAMQRTAILSDRYRHLAPQLEQLRQLDNQIASLTWNVPPPEQLAAYQTQLATLYQQRDEIDRSLSRDIPEMNLQKQLDTANRRAIALALPEGATLMEFVRFNVFNFKATFSIERAVFISEPIAALRNCAHASPFSITDFKDVVDHFSTQDVAITFHGAHILIFNSGFTRFELRYRQINSF